MKIAIEVAAYGWQGAAWDGFYPDDIPDDWRLDYYANEFFAVVVTWDEWRHAADEELLAWQGQVSDDFRFYWELPRGESDAAERLQRLRCNEEFMDHWGGVVADQAQLRIESPLQLRPLREAMEEAGRGAEGVVLVVIEPAAAASLRPARDLALLLGC